VGTTRSRILGLCLASATTETPSKRHMPGHRDGAIGGRMHRATADLRRMRARRLSAILVGLLSVVGLIGAATTATAGSACLDTRDGGYSYAGHQAACRGHGVRATIALTREPDVAGHVAGRVGVGGQGQGADGADAWIQAGIASLRSLGTVHYAEITREATMRSFS
jgi:hypothetical protein